MSEPSPRTREDQRKRDDQRLGIHPGLEPYYTIAEHTPTRLVLHSRPQANARAGYLFMARGAALGLLGLLVFCIGYFNFADQVEGALLNLLLATVCGSALAWFSAAGLIGGWAIARTTNRVTIDRETGTIVYAQSSRVIRQDRERTQTLPMDRVTALRLRPRWFRPPGILRPRRQILALELVRDTGSAWLVDSALEDRALLPVTTALSEVTGLPVERSQGAA